MQDKETIIISLGGAMVVPDMPNPEFILAFKKIILNWREKGKKFVIIVGGGKTCRRYQEALNQVIEAKSEDLDWIGIYSTQLNAQLLRLSFGSDAYEQVISDPDMVKGVNESIIIGSGWKPGCSTDTDAVLVAKDLGAKKIINLSNIDYVYDCDPRTNNNAKKFENLDWPTYRNFISSVWKPGSNTPFDPIASEMAEKEGMEVAFISGQNLESLEKYLNGETFTGTTIK